MGHDQRTSIKTNIHPKTQALLRLQLLCLVQNWTQYAFMTHMAIFTICKIPINILTLLIHNNKTCKILMLNNTNYMKTQMMTLSLKKNSNIFTQTLITIYISNNELRYHVNSYQWYIKEHWWFRGFFQYHSWLLSGNKGQNTSYHYHQS